MCYKNGKLKLNDAFISSPPPYHWFNVLVWKNKDGNIHKSKAQEIRQTNTLIQKALKVLPVEKKPEQILCESVEKLLKYMMHEYVFKLKNYAS